MKADIQRKFVFDSKVDGISRSYIFGYEKDNPSYEFLKTKVFCEWSSTSTSEETVYTHNLTQAKLFFSARVEALSRDQLETLYRKVTQHLLFNIFTITEDVDVCVAFETMNNRGKPLSYLELLKNRLIYLSLKFDADDSERKKLRRAINDCWKAIYHNLGRNKEQPLDDDRFLLMHYFVYFEKTILDESQTDEPLRYRRLYRADYASDLLEKRFIPKNVAADAAPDVRISLSDMYEYVSSLQESVETWYKMYNPFASDLSPDIQMWLDKLNRVGMDPLQHLVLVFLQCVSAENKRIAFLQAIERHLFILLSSVDLSWIPLLEIDPKTLQLAIDLSNDKITGEGDSLTHDATNAFLKHIKSISSKRSRPLSEQRASIIGQEFITSFLSTICTCKVDLRPNAPRFSGQSSPSKNRTSFPSSTSILNRPDIITGIHALIT